MPQGHMCQAEPHSDAAFHIEAAPLLNSALMGGSGFQQNLHALSLTADLGPTSTHRLCHRSPVTEHCSEPGSALHNSEQTRQAPPSSQSSRSAG